MSVFDARGNAGDTPVRAMARQLFVNAVAAGEACLVLGAGANGPLAPDWESLLDTLGTQAGAWAPSTPSGRVSRDLRIPLNARRDLSWTLGQLLRASGRDLRLFHGALYGGEASSPLQWSTERASQLRAAAALTIALASGGGSVGRAGQLPPQRELHPACDVVTYNIDVFFEEILAASGYDVEGVTEGFSQIWAADPAAQVARRERTLRLGLAAQEPEVIRVFHPHGILSRVTSRGGRPVGHNLIMTSEEYAGYRFNPMSLSSLVELQTYGERRCLFYGFSLADARVRDVLQATAKTRRLLLRRGSAVAFAGGSNGGDFHVESDIVPFDASHLALFSSPSNKQDPLSQAERRLETWRGISVRALGVVPVYGDTYSSLLQFLRTCSSHLAALGFALPDDEAPTPYPER